jgi:tetratricopeptide (TPR) repeat protein
MDEEGPCMATPQQRKSQARKQLIEQRAIIATIAILFLGVAVVLWILNGQGLIQGSWSNIFSIIFVFASVLIGLFQWLFPITNNTPAEPSRPNASPIAETSSPPQIVVQVRPADLLPTPTPAPKEEKTVYRGIMGLPPPTDPRTIQQRQQAVGEIYARLIQPTTSVVVLTGIGGVGKSTLAALTYSYAEEQRRNGQGPFTNPAVWLNIDPAVTMADLAGNLCEIFAKPLPDFSNLSLQHQALALFNILNTPEECRLLVLDQFEDLLDGQTGHALADRPGVGEWLDALNSQPCRSRLLMTTRPWPLGTREHPPTCMQEYTVRRLAPEEGVELLRKFGVEAADEALRAIVERCGGHAFALSLLASLLRHRKLTLAAFIDDQSYEHVWTGNVARNLLDKIYTSQLNAIQRKLLLAFSVYREPVPLSAAQALCDFEVSVSGLQIQQALDGLLAQHLLQATGGGSYQLHAIIEGYARDNFVVRDDQANELALHAAHARAAQYYRRLAASELPPDGQRLHLSDYDPLAEAAWQFCQAHQWREAYNLIVRERLFAEMKALGGLAAVLELYKLLLPLNRWQATPSEGARIYNRLGSIYRSLGRRELALRHLEQAIALCKEAGDTVEEGWSLNHLGRLYASMGEKERANAYYDEVLERAQSHKERVLEAAAFNNLGWISSAWGKRDLERKYYRAALAIYRELGDRTGEASTLNNLGRVSEDSGEYEQAQQYYQEALAIFQAIGNRRGCGWALNNLGRSSYFLVDDKAQARAYLEEALHIRREVDRKGEGRTLNNLGAVATGDGAYSHAWEYCLEALQISEEIADQEGRGKVLRNLGQVCFAQQRYPAALAFWLCARTILEEVQSPGREKLTEYLDRLQHELGDEAFFELLSSVEPRAEILVEQVLKEQSHSEASSKF